MKKLIKNFLLIFSTAFALAMPVATVAVTGSVSAQDACNTGDIKTGLQCGTCLNTTDPTACDASVGNPNDRVNTIIKTVINIFSLVVGVVSVIMIIVGGLKYITSGGESGQVQGAKNTILYAVIGLVVVALAQVIVRFVLNKVTS